MRGNRGMIKVNSHEEGFMHRWWRKLGFGELEPFVDGTDYGWVFDCGMNDLNERGVPN
jgi:hypothetical protein